jgi:hypothetical protein
VLEVQYVGDLKVRLTDTLLFDKEVSELYFLKIHTILVKSVVFRGLIDWLFIV